MKKILPGFLPVFSGLCVNGSRTLSFPAEYCLFFSYLFLFLFFFFSPDGCILINGPPISMDDPPGCFQEVDPIILGLDSADTSGLLDTNCFFPFMVNL